MSIPAADPAPPSGGPEAIAGEAGAASTRVTGPAAGGTRMLGAIAPQRRILRGPAPRPRRGPAGTSADDERCFLSNLEVLDALLAAADESLIARMSRLGMRRRQAHRFIIAATGRLLRAAQTQPGARPMRISPGLLEAVDLVELAARTRVSPRQASCGLSILLPELAALVTSLQR